MRTVERYLDLKGVPPITERVWGYFFLPGEKVKIVPDFNFNDVSSHPIIDSRFKGKIGIITYCFTDICCIHGSSYVCDVNFGGDEIRIMAMFLYTNKKFYDENRV
jgi:hypothetical protein